MFKKILVLVVLGLSFNSFALAQQDAAVSGGGAETPSNQYQEACGSEESSNADKRECCQNADFNTHACYVQLGVVEGLSGARQSSNLIGDQPAVEGQDAYEADFPEDCTSATDYSAMRNCLSNHCGNSDECLQAAAHYVHQTGAELAEDYGQVVDAHRKAVVDYNSASCNEPDPLNDAGLERCAELAEAVERTSEALDSEEAQAFGAYAGATENLSQQSDQARAMEALQSQTAFFDLNNISVGNEKNLEIGGSDNNESNILARMINIMARLFGTVAVLMLVIGAFFMIVSQGDENQLQKGKTIVLYTVIGLLVGFTAYIAVQFVINILFQT